MRVLIADDSAFMRRMLTKMFESARGIEVVGTARNGADAVAKVAEFDPDVVTMDVEMPEMNGLEALRAIRAKHGPARPAVLMCSTLTDAGSQTALEALRLGASDVIAKEDLSPTADNPTFRQDLINKVRAVGMRSRASMRGATPASRPATTADARPGGRIAGIAPNITSDMVEAVLIGSSTGGPPVLEAIIESLPSAPTRPILIAQHMPSLFTRSLAGRLDQVGPARVVLAEDQMPVERGTVYIAEGGKHLRLRGGRGRLTLEVSPEPADALYKPAVNELFASAATVLGRAALGVVLTGMGDDGLIGARAMHAAGATIVSQDEGSCVVYGMPRAVAEAGVSSASLSPAAIAGLVARVTGAGDVIPGFRRSA